MVILCQQNLKNIMQVRNSLQSKKKQSQKTRKTNQVSRKSKQNKRIKTMNSQQSASKSKSKSNGSKENIKNKKFQGKSKQKVSPIKIKNIKGCNTSPIINSERTPLIRVSPVKYEERHSKPMNSHREYEKAFQTVSTKINTQRTPNKRAIQNEPKKQPSNKCKKSTKNRPQKLQKPSLPPQPQPLQKKPKLSKPQKPHQPNFKKLKKMEIAPINTAGPQRKQSYFDEQTIERFNLDHGNYFRRRKPQPNANDSKKNNYSTQTHNLYSTSFREFGVETQPNQGSAGSGIKDLESLRKQQEMKWRIICLELNQLKILRTPDKIDQIIEQSHKNISQFKVKCKQINQSSNHYVIQSPVKVRDALTRRRKSSQQNKSLIKTLSDQRLLRELENLDHFDQNSQNVVHQEEKPINSVFCQQFEKQLEDYSRQHKNQAPAFLNFQLEHIPELEYQKSMQIYTYIFDILLLQLCSEMANSQQILHLYLSRQQSQRPLTPPLTPPNCQPPLSPFFDLQIKSSHSYSTDLLYKLFSFIKQRNYESTLLTRINKTLGTNPLASLKLLRNYFIQNQEDLYQDEESIQIIVDSDLLAEFESEKMEYHVEGQYYYNHCVYSCLNEILDTIRPFGLHGPPPLEFKVAPLHRNTDKIFDKVYEKITQILKIEMGKSEFDQGELDPLKVAERSYALMDKFLIQEQEQKWRKMQENIFEQKYFLAQTIISEILNDQIMIIYNEFL